MSAPNNDEKKGYSVNQKCIYLTSGESYKSLSNI